MVERPVGGYVLGEHTVGRWALGECPVGRWALGEHPVGGHWVGALVPNKWGLTKVQIRQYYGKRKRMQLHNADKTMKK